MNDKELLEFISHEFDMLDRDDATSYEIKICDALIKRGYMTIETIEDDDGRIIGEEYRAKR